MSAIPPEDLRFEVRSHLAGQPTASLSVFAIRHGLARHGIEADDEQILAALTFLADLQPGQVKRHVAQLGSSSRWQITAAGILAHERNE